MSASEKLKALRDQPNQMHAAWEIADKIPQIVAVVEAAEATDRAWFGAWARYALRDSHANQRVALAALDEALP